MIQAWGVDGHNSHTNICSASARAGYAFWAGFDRPSPDHANARVILLISSHLETGHYFNPHAQRIIEGKMTGAKLITLDPRLSNTASHERPVAAHLARQRIDAAAGLIANYLIQNDRYDRDFVRRWVNWEETLEAIAPGLARTGDAQVDALAADPQARTFDHFERALKALYREFTFERAAAGGAGPDRAHPRRPPSGLPTATGGWRRTSGARRSIGNLGGWQVARCLFFLNVLTGSVGTRGGTCGNEWNKFVPKPFATPAADPRLERTQFPDEWPLAHYEMSFLLPHLLEEGRGAIDVYFTRVYNPMWINPDGFMWLEGAADESKIKCHVALTPTWNESAWFADYVLPMGHAGERHDLMSQETHAGPVDRLPPAGAPRGHGEAGHCPCATPRRPTPARCGRRTSSGSSFRCAWTRRHARHSPLVREPLPPGRDHHGGRVLSLDLREQRAGSARGRRSRGADAACLYAQVWLL